MNSRSANYQLSRPLEFGDSNQIAAYEHLERVAAIERALEGDESDQHLQAIADALEESGWLEHIQLQLLWARGSRAASLPACGSLPAPIEAEG